MQTTYRPVAKRPKDPTKTKFSLYNGDVILEHNFGARGIRYIVSFRLPDGSYDEGRPTRGNTTIKNIKSKPFLMPWATKLCAEAFRDGIKLAQREGRDIDDDLLGDLVDSSKKAHITMRDKKAAVGSTVHDAIDMYLKGKPLPEMVPMEQRRFDAWLKWWQNGKYEVIFSERPVYSKNHDYATMIDVAFRTPEGKTILADWKTSKALYVDTVAQLGAGALCVHEETGRMFDDMWAIRIGPNEVEVKKVSNMGWNYHDAIQYFVRMLNLYQLDAAADKNWFKA